MHVDPQEFGAVKEQTKANGEMLNTINGKLDSYIATTVSTKERINWVWASLCGLGIVFAGGFAFLYALV